MNFTKVAFDGESGHHTSAFAIINLLLRRDEMIDNFMGRRPERGADAGTSHELPSSTMTDINFSQFGCLLWLWNASQDLCVWTLDP